jgi:putative methyltransferase (TIGR04325 family)
VAVPLGGWATIGWTNREAAGRAAISSAIMEANGNMRLYHLRRWPFVARRCKGCFQKVAYYVPPLLVDAIRHLASEWEYLPQGWHDGDPALSGWNDQSVAAAQEKHWPILVRNLHGPGPLGVSHFPWSSTREDRADHNAMMTYGYVLARAARKKHRLSILDWGGGVGHYYLYSKALVPEVEIDYHCYDLPALCAAGRKLLPDVQFHDDASDLFERRFDLIVSSSSLQYFEDWRTVLRKLATTTGDFLYIARLPTVSREPSFVVAQTPYHAGYYTQYRGWFLNRQELLACAGEAGMELEREFVFAEEWHVRGAPEKGECRGFLLRRAVPTSPQRAGERQE